MTHWFHVLATFPTQCLNAFSQDADGYCPLFCWHLSIINKKIQKSITTCHIFARQRRYWDWHPQRQRMGGIGASPGGWGGMEQLPENFQVKGQCMKKWSGYCREENWNLGQNWNSMNSGYTSCCRSFLKQRWKGLFYASKVWRFNNHFRSGSCCRTSSARQLAMPTAKVAIPHMCGAECHTDFHNNWTSGNKIYCYVLYIHICTANAGFQSELQVLDHFCMQKPLQGTSRPPTLLLSEIGNAICFRSAGSLDGTCRCHDGSEWKWMDSLSPDFKVEHKLSSFRQSWKWDAASLCVPELYQGMTPCVMPCPVVVEAAVGANAPATSVSAMSPMDDGRWTMGRFLVPGKTIPTEISWGGDRCDRSTEAHLFLAQMHRWGWQMWYGIPSFQGICLSFLWKFLWEFDLRRKLRCHWWGVWNLVNDHCCCERRWRNRPIS